MKIIKLFAVLLMVATTMTGCAVNRATATVDPSANLSAIKTMHVVKQPKDTHSIDMLIADKLRSKGYIVTTGESQPANVDATVTYIDKWMWDLTLYLLELTVNIRDPKNDFPLASGNSYHTSLTRKSPPEMVDEVIENILKSGKK